MKRCDLIAVRSGAEPGAMSLRDQFGAADQVKRLIQRAGFFEGERVSLVSTRELDELLLRAQRPGALRDNRAKRR